MTEPHRLAVTQNRLMETATPPRAWRSLLAPAGVAAATYRWARNGSRGTLFLADMVVPVLALLAAGPFIVDPSFMADFPVLAGAVVFALACGGFVAAVRPRAVVPPVEPPRPSA